MEIITSVTDEQFAELSKLTGQRVVNISLWDESLADALTKDEEQIAERKTQSVDSPHADIDLYLKEGVYFELYSAICFPDIQSEPIIHPESIEETVTHEIQEGIWLDEIAVDEEDQLVLVLSRNHQPVLYLVAAGWAMDGWEELPA